MRHHVTMMASLLVLVATGYMFGLVPKGFIPSEDTGQLLINTEAAQGVSYEQMVGYQQQLAAIVAKDPNVESFFSSVGVGGVGLTGNTGRIFMKLKPRSERPTICSRGHGQILPATQCRSADSRIATEAGACAGYSRFIAEPAGDPCRRTTQPQSLPVYPAESRTQRNFTATPRYSKKKSERCRTFKMSAAIYS